MEEIALPDVLSFEWDEWNSSKSWVKHRVSIKEQEEAFLTKEKILVEDKSILNRKNDFFCIAKQRGGED